MCRHKVKEYTEILIDKISYRIEVARCDCYIGTFRWHIDAECEEENVHEKISGAWSSGYADELEQVEQKILNEIKWILEFRKKEYKINTNIQKTLF